MDKTLYCGAAKACITPDDGLLTKLYGLMKRRFCKVHDDLYLRVIAFGDGENKALIISYDLDKATQPDIFLPRLSEETGIPVENMLYFGIHTHTAPITGPRPPFEQPPDAETAQATAQYEAFLLDTLLDTAKKAIADMVPAKIGVGYGDSYININRNQTFHHEAEDGSVYDIMGLGVNPTGPVDHTVFVLKAENMDGESIAFFVNYAVHNVVMITNNADGKGNVALGGDIGGNVSQLLEKRFGGVAVWSSGAAGDINPVMMNQYYYSDPADGSRKSYEVDSDEPAKAALQLMVSRHLDDVVQTIRGIDCCQTAGAIGGIIDWTETPSTLPDVPYRIRLQALRIGSTAFMGIGGELYTTLGWAIQDASPFSDTVVINHNCSLICECGYILDDDAIERGNVKLPGSASPRSSIPGGMRPRNLPGTVKPELEKFSRRMFTKLM